MLSSQSHMSVSVVYVLCVFILCPFFSLPSVSLSVRRWGFSFPTQSPRNPLHLLFIVCWLDVVVVGVTVLCLLDVVLTINSYTLQLHTERTQSDYLAMISLFCSGFCVVCFFFLSLVEFCAARISCEHFCTWIHNGFWSMVFYRFVSFNPKAYKTFNKLNATYAHTLFTTISV